MVSKRRPGTEGTEAHSRIITAAEQVIADEGHAAASTRRVAAVAGIKPSLVHYYFPTTDDLYLAVFRRGAAQSDAMIAAAQANADPIRALWAFFGDTSRSALSVEFIALAMHRPAIRAEITRHSEAMRSQQAALFERLIGPRLAALGCPPEALSLILAGIGRALFMEGALGVNGGHDAARAWVDRWIDELLGPPARA